MNKPHVNKPGKKLWFRNKFYGLGWMPVTKEGWLITIAYILFILVGELLFIRNLVTTQSVMGILMFFVYVAVITVGMLWICWKRANALAGAGVNSPGLIP